MMLRLLSCYLGVFGAMSIQVFCQFFFIGLFVFLLSYKSSLYTLDVHPYQILNLQIFLLVFSFS